MPDRDEEVAPAKPRAPVTPCALPPVPLPSPPVGAAQDPLIPFGLGASRPASGRPGTAGEQARRRQDRKFPHEGILSQTRRSKGCKEVHVGMAVEDRSRQEGWEHQATWLFPLAGI